MGGWRQALGALVVSALVSAALTGTAAAATPGKNGRILVERNGVLRIDEDPDTPAEVVVFDASTSIGNVRSSPDGTRIAFEFFDDGAGGTGRIQIGVARADGTGSRRLTSGSGNAKQPDWSPDGSRIVFSRENATGDRSRLVVMRADGTRQQPITSVTPNEFHFAPAWSPDGRTIAFTTSDPERIRIDLVRPDGTGRTHLDDSDTTQAFPDWSPDGRSIAFEKDGDIVIRTLATGAEVTAVPLARNPRFSPDGTRLLYEADRQIAPGVFRSGVWLHRRDVDVVDVLLAGDGAASPSWQPRCSIKGTAGNNTLTGTATAELICGKGGRDTIDGKGGLDLVFGGPGNDVLRGGGGPDVLVGADGDDTLNGGTGSDLCAQGPGSGRRTACER
jgi:dipeptidyl aminopeptidase/acylaminoacyl peptidase